MISVLSDGRKQIEALAGQLPDAPVAGASDQKFSDEPEALGGSLESLLDPVSSLGQYTFCGSG